MTPLLLALAVSAVSAALPAPKPELPEDLGPAVIDVSDYPPELRRTYEKIFLPVYGFLRGGPARAVNSPLIEIDPQGEAALRKSNPELFADPRLAQVGPDVWRREVSRVKNRPPCCGACPVLSTADAKALWKFLKYDSLRRKTGPRSQDWIALRRQLLREFEARKDKDQEGRGGRHP